LGNPWIFREINAYLKNQPIPARPSLEEITKVFFEHLDKTIQLYKERDAVLLFRKYPGWYFKGVRNIREVREKSSHAKTKADFINILQAAGIMELFIS